MSITPMAQKILEEHLKHLDEIHAKGLDSMVRITAVSMATLADPFGFSRDGLIKKIQDTINPFDDENNEINEEN